MQNCQKVVRTGIKSGLLSHLLKSKKSKLETLNIISISFFLSRYDQDNNSKICITRFWYIGLAFTNALLTKD